MDINENIGELFDKVYNSEINVKADTILLIKEQFGIGNILNDEYKEGSYIVSDDSNRYVLTVSQKEHFDNFIELLKIRLDDGIYNQINIDYTDIKDIIVEVVR